MHVQKLLSLKNKVILVTGGAGKFGRSMVAGLAEAGGTIILASRSLEVCQKVADTLKAEGYNTSAMQLDQALESVRTLKAAITDQFGRLDVFVNNAYALTMLEYDYLLDDWAKSMAVNATGMFNLTREMIRLMERDGGGIRDHIGSMKFFSVSFELYQYQHGCFARLQLSQGGPGRLYQVPGPPLRP